MDQAQQFLSFSKEKCSNAILKTGQVKRAFWSSSTLQIKPSLMAEGTMAQSMWTSQKRKQQENQALNSIANCLLTIFSLVPCLHIPDLQVYLLYNLHLRTVFPLLSLSASTTWNLPELLHTFLSKEATIPVRYPLLLLGRRDGPVEKQETFVVIRRCKFDPAHTQTKWIETSFPGQWRTSSCLSCSSH